MRRRLVGVRREALGDQHPATAAAMHALAGLLAQQQQQQRQQGQAAEAEVEAEQLYRAALGLRREVLGGLHPDAATTACALAGLLARQGRLPEAEDLLWEAQHVRWEALGKLHPATGACFSALADLVGRQQRPEEAEELCGEALDIMQQVECCLPVANMWHGRRRHGGIGSGALRTGWLRAPPSGCSGGWGWMATRVQMMCPCMGASGAQAAPLWMPPFTPPTPATHTCPTPPTRR